MIGVYDFCGHYEWTFEWLQQLGGDPLIRDYWDEAIHRDSQHHASALIEAKGIDGMREYWSHTLEQEDATYSVTATPTRFRLDMHVCPSKGFLLRNDLKQYHDYCDHCIGWIGPMMHDAGFVIDHQHNHCGQCWWEMHRLEDTAPIDCATDVRLRPGWTDLCIATTIDTFKSASGPDGKMRSEEL